VKSREFELGKTIKRWLKLPRACYRKKWLVTTKVGKVAGDEASEKVVLRDKVERQRMSTEGGN